MKDITEMVMSSLLPFLLLTLSSATDSAANIILPGSSQLHASNTSKTWSSPYNSFSLGFRQVGPSSYVAAISYSGGVPVWTAGGVGASVDAGGYLAFLPNGALRLVNGTGAVVWDSGTADLGVSSAILEDSGNLVLQHGTVSIWSSFQHPTDTILASQNFTVGQILRSGSYSFRLLGSGNLTLTWNDSVVFWNQGLNSSVQDSNLTSASMALQPSGVLSIFDSKLTGGVNVVYSSDYGEGNDVFRFLRLDHDGNLRIYSSTRGSGNKTVRWAAFSDQCQVFGYCGNMGICTYNESDPVCGCPSQNFEPVDTNDSTKGCKRKVEIENCSDSLTMLVLEHTKFLTYQTEEIFYLASTSCSLNCLSSSSCIASTALADGSGSCYMKPLDFVSGFQSLVVPSTSYMKVCGPVASNLPFSKPMGEQESWWKRRAWIVVLLFVTALLLFGAIEGSLIWWFCRKGSKYRSVWAQYSALEYASGAPVHFSYKELQHLTKGFKEKVGAGGFGTVYKGVLADRTEVAVKQLEGIEQGEKQFRMEVATISSTHHLNLVKLIGFCSEGRHRLLVYEFMKNGSLDNFLFEIEGRSRKSLNWPCRFDVALGTARGIAYLHEECRDCIVHCDIKPENILLDENYRAKVSDFGLAKLMNSKDHRYRTLTSVRGTRGYLAPEWLTNLPVTLKSDVYSYGMVLLEIVSGRRNFDVSAETDSKKFSSWAYEEFEKDNWTAIIDERFADQDLDMEQIMRAIMVSFWCIQEQPSHRPMMGKVVQMLEGIIDIQKPPAPVTVHEVSTEVFSISTSSYAIDLPSYAASAPPSTFQISGTSAQDSRTLKGASSSLLRSYYSESQN